MPPDCPTEQELLDYHVGRLSAADLDRIAAHLETCPNCADIILRVEAKRDDMLAALRGIPPLEASSPQNIRRDSNPPRTEIEGDWIGPYRLVKKIGEGGMGVIYLAEQEQPVRRRVALKVIKPGMDTARVIERFEAERRALAVMDHPNVARIFDAGVTLEGRPYFVMELVHGPSITSCCDDARLTADERCRLFVAVCRAVQHAHQKGVIHRDLKPSNVLVTTVDGKLVPKVIDFGIAKAIDQTAIERSLFTHFGSFVGTLEYMSPEQAAPEKFDVDTRSDVYSLGVLLFELLTGSTPLRAERLREHGYAEALRRIKEEETPKPSTRLEDSRESLGSIAAARGVEPMRLMKAIRGEIDWIVLKSLEKNRRRRYDSAGEFADDLERFLAGEPVRACPPTLAYRLSKFARRNRAALAVITAFACTLIIATVVSTLLMLRAIDAEGLATRRGNDLETANTIVNRSLTETQIAQKETQAALKLSEEARREAETVSDFLFDTFRRPDPALDGRAIKIADVLDRASESLLHSFKGTNLTKAAFLSALGMTYHGLGLYDRAVPLLSQSVAIRERELGSDHSTTLTARNALTRAYTGTSATAVAIDHQKETLHLCESKLDVDHETTIVSRDQLGALYLAAGRTNEALALHERNKTLAESKLGLDHAATLSSRSNLAHTYLTLGRTADAIALDEKTLERAEVVFGLDDPKTLEFADGLANDYSAAGRTADAIRVHAQTLQRREAKLGPSHTDTLSSRNNLAMAFQLEGLRIPEAVKLHEANLRIREAALPSDHMNVLATRNNLAAAYVSVGRIAEAISLHEVTLARCEVKFGVAHPNTLTSRSALALAYLAASRTDEAIRLHELTLKQRVATLGKNHPSTLVSVYNLAVSYAAAGRLNESIALLETCVADAQRILGSSHPRTLLYQENLATNEESRGSLTRAIAVRQSVIAGRRAAKTSSMLPLADSLAALANTLAKLQKWDEAEACLREAVTIRESASPEDWTLYHLMSGLGEMLVRQGRYREAEPLLVQGFAGLVARQNAIPAKAGAPVRIAALRVVDLYTQWQKPLNADEWRQKLGSLIELPADSFHH